MIVYAVAAGRLLHDMQLHATRLYWPGTRIPDDLLLVHERTDHYSLQPAKDMTLLGKC